MPRLSPVFQKSSSFGNGPAQCFCSQAVVLVGCLPAPHKRIIKIKNNGFEHVFAQTRLRLITIPVNGFVTAGVAEWLCAGLQSRIVEFDSRLPLGIHHSSLRSFLSRKPFKISFIEGGFSPFTNADPYIDFFFCLEGIILSPFPRLAFHRNLSQQ